MTRHLLHLAFLLLLSGPVFTGAAAQTAVRLSERSITIRGEQYLIHKVRKGETLYAIAKAYAVSQEEIMKANSLTRDVLRARQILLIPKRAQKRRAAGQTHAGDAGNRPQERPEPQIRTDYPFCSAAECSAAGRLSGKPVRSFPATRRKNLLPAPRHAGDSRSRGIRFRRRPAERDRQT